MSRTLAFAFFALLAAPAAASESCVQLARAILVADPAFPQVTEGSAQEIADWPASCAATPPTGEGKLVQICSAMASDGPIYFWLRQAKGSQTLGYERCAG